MEILKNLLAGLLAGDLGLWSLVAIVALVAWVVADAAILGRGMQKAMWDGVHDQSASSELELPRLSPANEDYFLHGGIEPVGYIGVGARHDD